MTITDAEVEAAHRWFQENGEWVPPSLSIRAALLAASQARALSSGGGWQDIATAPHDTSVLIFVPRSENIKNLPAGTQYVARKTRPDPPFVQSWRFASGPGQGQQAPWPTHWQPLPQPPSKDNTNE